MSPLIMQDDSWRKVELIPMWYKGHNLINPLKQASTNPSALTVIDPSTGKAITLPDGLLSDAISPQRQISSPGSRRRSSQVRSRREAQEQAKNSPPPQANGDLALQDVLHTQESGAMGTNPGGWFRGKDDQRRYVKLYTDPAQANGEHLANLIYRGVGLPAPESTLYPQGKSVVYTSKEMPGEIVGLFPTPKDATDMLKGFAADVLLGNWDVIGLEGDNVMRHPSGQIQRIDNGGALLSRAMGSRKPDHLLMDDTEWDTFSGKSEMYSVYQEFFDAAGIHSPEQIAHDIIQQIERLEAYRQSVGGWNQFVQTHTQGLSDQDKLTLVRMLDARSSKLNARAKSLQGV